ncbi:MAG: AI-2E family transporter [Caldilineaceae bacterium]|nr:AI-2E family transporter [Caldilineaceae bacterium]
MNYTHRIGMQAWLSLLSLGLIFWFIINNSVLLFKLLAIVLGAWLLSLAIRPIADRLARRQIPRGVTTVSVFIVSVGFLVLLGTLLRPVIQAETAELRQRGPTLWQTVAHQAVGTQLGQAAPAAQSMVNAASSQWETVVSTAVGTVAGLGGLLLNLLVLLFLTYFLTTDPTWASNLLWSWLPQHQHARVQVLANAITQRLTRWVWAQVALSLFFAIVFSAGLWFMGIPFAFTIGMVGGVLTIVPYAGGLIGAALAVLSALTLGVSSVIWVLLLFMLVTIVQTHLLAPLLYGRAMGLHAALALLALFIGAELAGIVGVLFAVPVAVIAAVILHELQGAFNHADDPNQPSDLQSVDGLDGMEA